MTITDRLGRTVSGMDLSARPADPNPDLAIKTPVVCSTTAAITLSGLQTIDGVTVVEGDRVLVKNQANAAFNGIYNASTGIWRRSKDFDGSNEVVNGTMVRVTHGTTLGDSSGSVSGAETSTAATISAARVYYVSSPDPVYIGTSDINFVGEQANSSLLSSIASLNTAGIIVNKGDGSAAARKLTGTADEITVTNGDGVSGNPTLSLPNALSFAGKTVTGGTFSGITISLLDSAFTLQDNSDPSRRLQFQLSGISTATTRTLTIPDASGTIALTSSKLSAFAATTSSELASVISDETGSGALVFATAPSLTTPILGVASSTSESITGTGGAGYLQLANQSSNPGTPTSALRLYGDSSGRLSWKGTNGFVRSFDGLGNTADRSYVLPDLAGTIALTANKLSVFAATTSAELAGVLSDETGSGLIVFNNGPTLIAPALGTPASIVLTNASGTASSLTAGNATNVGVTDDNTTNAGMSVLWVNGTSGNLPAKGSSSKLVFTPSSGTLAATVFSGSGASLTNVPTTALTGTLQAAQEPAHTGDVTNSAGSLALAIGATKVTSAMLNADVFSTAHSWAGIQTLATPILTGLPTGTGVATANTASTLVARDASGNFAAGTITAALSGNATTATSATSATSATNTTNVGVTDDNSTNATMNVAWLTSNTGNLPVKTSSSRLVFNPSTGNLSATTFTGAAAITGGTTNALTSLGIRSTGAAFDVKFASSEVLTANRTVTWVLGDAARTVTLGGNPTINGGTHSGTNTGDQTITLTGNVTGSGTGSFAATIGANQVANSMLATMANNTVKGNVAGSTATPTDLSATQLATLLATVAGVMKSKTGTFSRVMSTASGTATVTGVGFQPTSVIIFGVNSGTRYASWGFADSSGSGFAFYSSGAAALFNSAGSVVLLIADNDAPTNYVSATIATYDSDGFTLSYTKTGSPTSTATFFYLAFR